jgi:hypothetical protein
MEERQRLAREKAQAGGSPRSPSLFPGSPSLIGATAGQPFSPSPKKAISAEDRAEAKRLMLERQAKARERAKSLDK